MTTRKEPDHDEIRNGVRMVSPASVRHVRRRRNDSSNSGRLPPYTLHRHMSATGSVPAGTRVGRYEIVSLLRRGGMGEVYEAHDRNLGRRVALTILPEDRTS